MVHVKAQDFAEMGRQVLAVALRILLRAGVAHPDVEESVRAKLNAAAAVVLRHAHDLPQTPRRPLRVGAKIRRCQTLDHDGGNLSFFKYLVLEIVFAILAKARMKRQAKQSVWSTLVEDFFRH